MKQGRITKIVLAIIFAGLVVSPLVIKRLSSGRDSGSVKLNAKEALADFQKRRPDITSLARIWQTNPNFTATPEYVALRVKTFDVGLSRAGLPEQ